MALIQSIYKLKTQCSKQEIMLLEKAEIAAQKAYAPYSHFHVGSAILTKSGKIYTGCNIENRSFGLTNCAERTAVFKAISEGESDFEMIAIASPDSPLPLPPCGACRQVLSEFSKKMSVIFSGANGKIIISSIEELYPFDSLDELKHRKNLP